VRVLERYAKLACVLPADLASRLCAPFAWQELLPADAKALAALGQAQGGAWLQAQLMTWAQKAPLALYPSWRPALGEKPKQVSKGETQAKSEAAAPWPDPLPLFIDAAIAAQWPAQAVEEVLIQAMKWLQRMDARAATPALLQSQWPERLQAVCQLALALQRLQRPQDVLHQLQALLQHLTENAKLYPATELLPVLRTLSSPAVTGAAARHALLGRVKTALQAALRMRPAKSS
jgi:hypothetical protein